MHYKTIILTALLAFSSMSAMADSLPAKDGERARYNVQIDIRKAYISGVCAMLFENGKLKASIVNEFGCSAIDFEYDPQKNKVRIISIVKNLNHWYMKRVLKHDLCQLIHNLQNGVNMYEDAKYDITYTFTPMEINKDETTE